MTPTPDPTVQQNLNLAERWLQAFNAHDVSSLVQLYDPAATHSSPKIRALHPDTGGKISGHSELTQWWSDAIRRLPTLRYQTISLTADSQRVWMEYWRHVEGEPSAPVGEVLEIKNGRIVASRVYHG